MSQPTFNQSIGVFFIRVLLGLIFCLQGFTKVFKWGIDSMYKNAFETYEDSLPKVITVFTAYYTSYVELIAGFLLIVGFFRNYALYALGSVLLIVSFGHGLKEGIWDLNHVIFRAILLIALFLLPGNWDKWQLGNLLNKTK
ncbi:MAG: DoxX family protein [Bacteroidetes bacterium]|nr:DoxX family protein [Bacteroidota bacterium]